MLFFNAWCIHHHDASIILTHPSPRLLRHYCESSSWCVHHHDGCIIIIMKLRSSWCIHHQHLSITRILHQHDHSSSWCMMLMMMHLDDPSWESSRSGLRFGFLEKGKGGQKEQKSEGGLHRSPTNKEQRTEKQNRAGRRVIVRISNANFMGIHGRWRFANDRLPPNLCSRRGSLKVHWLEINCPSRRFLLFFSFENIRLVP